jgi:hypothetical protein
MRGATGSVAGRRGLVPKPAAADNVKYLKGDGTWSALSNASAATNAEASAGTSTTTFLTPANAGLAVAKVSNSRAPRQGLVFNQTTSASFVNVPPFGTGDFTCSIWINQKTLANAAAISGPTNAFQISLNRLGDGYLTVTNSGVAHVLDVNASAYIQADKFQLISCVRSSGTVAFYVNGISVGGGAVASDFSVGCTYVGGGVSTAFTNSVIVPLIYNRALSAAEVVTLYESGAPASADYNVASNTTLFGAANWVDAGGFTGFASASPAVFSATSAGGAAFAQQNSPISVVKGTKYRFTITTNAGAQTAFLNAGGNTEANTVQALAATGGIVEITAAATGVSYLTVRCVTGFTTASAAALTPLGLLLAPESNAPGSGRQWRDVSGAVPPATIVLPASGVSWALPGTGDTSYAQRALTANGELLDTAGVLHTDSVLVDVIVKNTTANAISGFGLGMSSGVRNLTYETLIPANSTVVLPILRADLAGLTVGTAPYGRVYYSAGSWNSGSLNISIRYRRERDL